LAARFPGKVKELEQLWQAKADQFARDAGSSPKPKK